MNLLGAITQSDLATVLDLSEARVSQLAEGLPHLMNTLGLLARLDEAAVARVRLPQRCADAVEAWLGTP